MTKSAPASTVVFLGPSLPADQAHELGPLEVRPPAQRGDVWRAVDAGATVIALVDGLFERVPSVWHRELIDALESGVAVLGASSMGALRAAELGRFGMIGVGTIASWYARGRCIDDGDVALVHSDAEHGFRPLSVPHVNVLWNVERARKARVLRPRDARGLLEASERLFYPDRIWPEVIARAEITERAQVPFRGWLERHEEDLKSIDARACVVQALALARGWHERPRPPPTRFSSLVRRVRLLDGVSGGGVPGARVLGALEAEGATLSEAGLRRALLAAWAREQGMTVAAAELDALALSWAQGIGEPSLAAALSASGLTRAELDTLLEEVALESRLLRHSSRVTADGPSAIEALASQARLTGAWARAARRRRT